MNDYCEIFHPTFAGFDKQHQLTYQRRPVGDLVSLETIPAKLAKYPWTQIVSLSGSSKNTRYVFFKEVLDALAPLPPRATRKDQLSNESGDASDARANQEPELFFPCDMDLAMGIVYFLTPWGHVARLDMLPPHWTAELGKSARIFPSLVNGSEYVFRSDLIALRDRLSRENARPVVLALNVIAKIIDAAKKLPCRVIRSLRKGFRDIARGSPWARASQFLALSITIFTIYLMVRPGGVPLSKVEGVMEAIGTVFVLIGTIEIGLGVELNETEEQGLSKSSDRIKTDEPKSGIGSPELGTLLIKASRCFRSGMRIVAIGTAFLVVKMLVSATHIGEAPAIPCKPVESNSGSNKHQPQQKKIYLCEFEVSSQSEVSEN